MDADRATHKDAKEDRGIRTTKEIDTMRMNDSFVNFYRH